MSAFASPAPCYRRMPPPYVVTDATIGPGPDEWLLIADATGTGDSTIPIVFELIPGRVYNLVEIAAPPGIELPRVQWQLVAAEGETFTITAAGDPNTPALLFLDGSFYVGNRPRLILPPFGGGASTLLMAGGLLFIFLALGAVTYQSTKSKKGLKH